jgi:chemotaxis protein CheC
MMICASSLELDSLRRLCVLATQNAAVAMCRWTATHIALTLEEVCEVPLENLCAELQIGDEFLTMVVLASGGETGAEIILMFDETSAATLAARFLPLKMDDPDQQRGLEDSVLCETGNILACAYLNTLANLIGRDLLPASPVLIRDYGASVLEQAMMGQAACSDQVLVCRTTFEQDGQRLKWQVLFVPTEATRRQMEQAFDQAP